MRVIAHSTLVHYYQQHPEAKQLLKNGTKQHSEQNGNASQISRNHLIQ